MGVDVGVSVDVPVVDGVVAGVTDAIMLGVLDEDGVIEGDAPDEREAEGVGEDDPVSVALVVGVPLLERVGVPVGAPVDVPEPVPDNVDVAELSEIMFTTRSANVGDSLVRTAVENEPLLSYSEETRRTAVSSVEKLVGTVIV